MPQSIKHTAQAVSTPITLHSATLRLVKVESGIKGLLPTSWAPPIYSVSLLTKLHCALAGNGLLHLAAVRSFLARICQMQKPTKMIWRQKLCGEIYAAFLARNSSFWNVSRPKREV